MEGVEEPSEPESSTAGSISEEPPTEPIVVVESADEIPMEIGKPQSEIPTEVGEQPFSTIKNSLKEIKEAIDPKASFGKNISNVAKAFASGMPVIFGSLKEVVKETVIIVQELADDPKVEKITKNIVVPVVISTTVATFLPSFASVALPLTKFLFFQPLLFLGIRRRKKWGKLYNSLNKLPIELATLRLIDVKTNKIVQTRVTDNHGYYGFLVVPPGEYRIEVDKKNFVFPSKFLMNESADGRLIDIYHGEKITIDNNNINIVPNIPIDPIAQEKTPIRIKVEKRARAMQKVIAAVGISTTLVSLYVVNIWYIWVFLGIHITTYVVFLKFISPKKLKGWGKVYDTENKNPIDKAFVRLYNKQYNK